MKTKTQLQKRMNQMIQEERKNENFKFSKVIRLKRIIEISEGIQPEKLNNKEII